MTTLAVNKPRAYPLGNRNMFANSTTTIYEGAAVGLIRGTGLARALQAGDIFAGFAEHKNIDPILLSVSAWADVIASGFIELPVTGAVATDIGLPIYASDDNAFTFSPVGGVFIGFVHRVPATGTVVINFDATSYVDPHAGFTSELKSVTFTADIQSSGKLFCIDTDAVFVNLPATAAGGSFKCMNIGAYGTVGFSLAPQAVDKVQGPNIAGTDNKKLILTKATARRGDFAELVFGQADGPYVRAIRGTWTTEL